jgi:hypothetical protein
MFLHWFLHCLSTLLAHWNHIYKFYTWLCLKRARFWRVIFECYKLHNYFWFILEAKTKLKQQIITFFLLVTSYFSISGSYLWISLWLKLVVLILKCALGLPGRVAEAQHFGFYQSIELLIHCIKFVHRVSFRECRDFSGSRTTLWGITHMVTWLWHKRRLGRIVALPHLWVP